jgi:phage-related protein
MTELFDWRVHATASGGGDFTTNDCKFGDGYMQSTVAGLNNEVQKWNVTVEAYRAEMLAGPLAFIRARQGMSFFWTPPLGDQGYYRCKRYSGPTDQGGGLWTLNMEFEQVFFA